jgi:hypothetical protein
LAGRSLRVRIDYADPEATPSTVSVMFTRDGHVLPLRVDEPFAPHVEVRGTRQEVHAFLAGAVDLLDAVLAKLVVLRIPEAEVVHYRPLRALVAEELRAG